MRSEKKAQAELHNPIARFPVDPPEGWRVRVVVNGTKKRMIEEVRRFQTKIQIALSILGEIEFIERGAICAESARVPHIRVYGWNVPKAVVGGANKGGAVEHPGWIGILKGAAHHDVSPIVHIVVQVVPAAHGPANDGVRRRN